MTQVNAGITTSLDGYIVGPNDGPGRGLGDGGERLHYWVFGGPWTYDEEPRGDPTGADKEVLDDAFARVGAVVGGRTTYEAAEAWGGHDPFGVPFFILTHRPEAAPADDGFTFVNGLDEEVHTFVNDLERNVGTYLYGRRMYEVMVAWETMDLADQPPFIQDFAKIWREADKIVYSKTLETASSDRTRLERDFEPEDVRQLKATGGRDIAWAARSGPP